MSAPTPAQRRALAAAAEHPDKLVDAPARTLAVLVREGWVNPDGTLAEDGHRIVEHFAALGTLLDELAPRRARKAAAGLVVVDEGDERSAYCCGSAYTRIRALGAGWTWRLVHGVGTIAGTAPKPVVETAESGPASWGLWAGIRGEDVDDGRKTIDVDVPVHSISLRLRHRPSGFAAVACWTWRSDRQVWCDPMFYAWHPIRRPQPRLVSAKAFELYTARDHSAPAVAA